MVRHLGTLSYMIDILSKANYNIQQGYFSADSMESADSQKQKRAEINSFSS